MNKPSTSQFAHPKVGPTADNEVEILAARSRGENLLLDSIKRAASVAADLGAMPHYRDHVAGAFDRILDRAAAVVRAQFSDAVRQVYAVDDRQRPEPIGSCVLIRVRDHFFAFTAAHVLDQGRSARLYVGGASGIVSLPEAGLYTPTHQGGRDADHLDVGVLEFERDAAAGLGPVQWIQASEFDPVESYTSVMLCTALGYPYRRSRVLMAHRQVESRLDSVTSFVDPALYESLGLNPALHVPLSFSRKRMRLNGQRATAPLLHGTRGGGIWRSLTSQQAVQHNTVNLAVNGER